MNSSTLKIVYITMEITPVLHSLMDSSINVVGLVESRRKNPSKQTMELRHFCEEKQLPYYFMNEGCSVGLENWLKSLEPDLIVIFGMSELLKKNIIQIPKKGCINLHPSFLPNYRGGYPIFWTYYYVDLHPGVTVHYIDEGEDTGDVIYQECIDLPLGATEEELMAELIEKKGIELLMKAIHDIENDCAPRIKQPDIASTLKARQIHPNEYKYIIDWETWDITRIWHLLRGTQNWLNAFDFSDIPGDIKKWRILNYSRENAVQGELGKVLQEGSQYFVNCAQGKIYLELTIQTKESFANVVV